MSESGTCETYRSSHDQKKRDSDDVPCGGQINVHILNVNEQGRVNIFQGHGSELKTEKPVCVNPKSETKKSKVEK